MDLRLNLLSLIGVYIFCILAWLLSVDRKKVPWETIKWGLGIQFFLAFIFLSFPFLLKILSFFVSFFNFIYKLPFSNDVDVNLGIFSSIYKDANSIKSLGGTLILVIFFVFIESTKFYKKILNVLSNFFTKTFHISGEEGLVSIFSFFFSLESFFLAFSSIRTMGISQLFTLITVVLSSSSVFLITINTEALGSTFPGVKGHLTFASILSVFSAIVVSKIIYPIGYKKDSISKSSNSVTLWDGGIIGVKFIGGILLGGFIVICITNLFEGVLYILGNFQDIKILNTDSMPITLLKYIKIALVEVFHKVTFRNLIAILLLPFCLLSGISFELVELWRISLIFSQTILGSSDKFVNLIPMYKDGIYTDRSILLAFYLLNGSTSLAFLGMVYGGLLNVVPERSSDLYKLLLRSFPAAILSQFITAAIIGVFDFGNPNIF
jgi:CNT family concentrative nucleoside transporter